MAFGYLLFKCKLTLNYGTMYNLCLYYQYHDCLVEMVDFVKPMLLGSEVGQVWKQVQVLIMVEVFLGQRVVNSVALE